VTKATSLTCLRRGACSWGPTQFLVGGILLLATTLPAIGETFLVTPAGGPAFDENGRKLADASFPYGQPVFSQLKPGDVIQLAADKPDPSATTVFEGYVLIEKQGDRTSAPIVLRGLGRRTKIQGKSIEQLRGCERPTEDADVSCDQRAVQVAGRTRDLLTALTDAGPSPRIEAGPRVGDVPLALPAFGKRRLEKAVCVDINEVDGFVVEDLVFERCWISAVRAFGSRRLTLRRLLILESSYGVAAKGTPEHPTDAITVEDVTWVQDVSGYASISREGPQRCSDGRETELGCPGVMWRQIPWGASHHGSHEHFNGALVGGVNIKGDVIFRRNKVFNAYNGIRLKPKKCEAIHASDLSVAQCPFNIGVWVYDSVFSYVRDNPIEMEVWSSDVKVFGNRLHNAHAWFSFDDMGGGPIYIYGNRGWFDDMPALKWSEAARGGAACSRDPRQKQEAGGSFDPVLDRRFDYDKAAWLPIAMLAHGREDGQPGDTWMLPDDQLCETSIVGRTLKFALPERDRKPNTFRYPVAPIYIFNNSWFLRAPIMATSAAANVRHWNNAILFCEPGISGYDPELCKVRPSKLTPDNCGKGRVRADGLERLPGERGTIPFFDCFRWLPYDELGKDRADLASSFDYDVSSNGFPIALKQMTGSAAHSRMADPGFSRAHQGEFTLVGNAAAATSSCLIEDDGSGALSCKVVDPKTSFAGAYDAKGHLYRGPQGTRFAPP
jgi:hypothetical protein